MVWVAAASSSCDSDTPSSRTPRPTSNSREQLAGDVEHDGADVGRLGQRAGAGAGLEIAETDLQVDGARRESRGAQAGARAVGEPDELALALRDGAQIGAERLLGADRLGVAFGNDVARVVVARERVQVAAEARAERCDERRLVGRGDVADRAQAHAFELGQRRGPDAPQPRHRQRREERRARCPARRRARRRAWRDRSRAWRGTSSTRRRPRCAARPRRAPAGGSSPAIVAADRRACGGRRPRRRTPRRSRAARRAARSTRGSP